MHAVTSHCLLEVGLLGTLLACTVALPPPLTRSATAAALTPKAALARLFTSTPLEPAWFSEAFLAQVPLASVEALLVRFRQQLGPVERIEGETSPFTVVFAQGTTTAQIALDAQGRIVGLRLQPPTPAVGSLAEAVAHLRALPGDVGLLVQQGGTTLAAVHADKPLAVGSAFKLAVLATLQAQIKAGAHAWDEVVRLQPAWKSLPSGLLQRWPDGSPVTLHTLATLMISISDNTAADALLHIVGRAAVEASTPCRQPFLSTQEVSKLKAPANATLLARYRSGNEAEKRQVLQALHAVPLPAVQDVPTEPTALDVEWYCSAEALCTLMAQVEALDLMTIEPGPGVAHPERWQRVTYKGGSEPGVLNLTTWLQAKDGSSYCVAATLNRTDAPVDDVAFVGLYRALVGTLR